MNDLIGVLNRRVEAASGDEDAQVDLLRRIAELWLSKFSNPNQAVQALQRILELRSHDARAIDHLIEIFGNRRDWRSLYAIYERQLEILEGASKVERLAEMASIAADKLGEPDKAIELWRSVVELDASVEKAWRSLEKLYQKTSRWAELAQLYSEEVERSESTPVDQVAWLKKLGSVYAERLDDEDQAADAWRAILRVEPGEVRAEAALRELYLRRDDWASLEELFGERDDFEGFIRLASRHVGQYEDVGSRVALYKRMARVLNNQLARESNAVECWEKVLSEDSDDIDAARALASYYEREAGWDQLVDVLEVILRHEPEDHWHWPPRYSISFAGCSL